MERRLDGSERPGPDPGGVTIRPYRDGDGPALHRVLETSFEGHFGFEPMPYDAWEAANLRAPSMELDLFLLAERGGEQVAALTIAFDEGGVVGGRARRPRGASRYRDRPGAPCGGSSPSSPGGDERS
jgi:hypothetical protein